MSVSELASPILRVAKSSNDVNVALHDLRTLIPTEPRDRKLSKIETLRLACGYIRHLEMQRREISCDQTGNDCIFCYTAARSLFAQRRP